jgi:hypothetical protein
MHSTKMRKLTTQSAGRDPLEQVDHTGGSVPRRRRDEEVDVVWLDLKGQYLHTMLSGDGEEKFRQAGLDRACEDPTAILGDPDDVAIEIVDTGSGLADSHGMVLVQMFWERKSPGKDMSPLGASSPKKGREIHLPA